MIEYTITPRDYDAKYGHLVLDLWPTIDSLEPKTIVVALSTTKIEEILVATDITAQKAIIRKEVLKFNDDIQEQWAIEVSMAAVEVPSELMDLLGVPGTTPVTQIEIDAG